jgi:dihydrofolate reductase
LPWYGTLSINAQPIDLVDELRLMVYPVVLGAGERLFGETSDKKPMRLTGNRTVGDGLAFLTYERARDA